MKQMSLRLFNVKDAANVGKLFYKLREQPFFFDDRYRDDPYRFANLIVAKTTVVLELGDFQGIYYASSIEEDFQACATVAVWDKEFMGKHGVLLAQQACLSTMRAHGLHKLYGFIQEKNDIAVSYAKRIGFQVEGTIRDHVWYNGAWENLIYFGVLRDEMESKLAKDTDGRQPERITTDTESATSSISGAE